MHPSNKAIFIFTYVLFGVCLMVKSQPVSITKKQESKMVQPVINRAEQLPLQQIYLQTDKDIYETQENLWFFALCKNVNNQIKNTDAQVFFLTLLNGKNEVVSKAKFSIKNGRVQGKIYLKEFLTPGFYHLIGYTKESILPNLTNYKTLKQIEIRESVIPKVLVSYKEEAIKNNQIKLKIDLTNRSGDKASNLKIRLKGINNTKAVILDKTNSDSLGNATLIIDREKALKFKKFECELLGKKKFNQKTPFFLSLEDLETPELKFYPESDSLVHSIDQKVGFTVVLKNGRPASFKGLLLENGKTIDTIQTSFNGLGSFQLNPRKNKQYSIQSVNNANHTFNLPRASKRATSFQLNRITEKYIYLSFKTNNISSTKGTVFIRLQSKGRVVWLGKGKLFKNEQLLEIPINKVPSGIVEVRIFDKQFRSVYSRLVYVHANKKLTITQLNSLEETYKPKSEVVLQLHVKDAKQLPKSAKINVRVLDHLYDNTVDDRNMASFYGLESDISMHITRPAIYYTNDAVKSDSLNLFLLNTKTDFYIWNTANTIKHHGEFNIQEDVVGKVLLTSKKGTLKASGATQIQFFNSKGISVFETDEAGMFKIPKQVLELFDGEAIFIKTTLKNGIIKILKNENNIFQDDKLRLNYPETYVLKDYEKNSQLKDQVASFRLNGLNYLDEVVVKTTYKKHKKNPFLEKEHIGTNFDYVCREYNILNCSNHRTGYKPIEGHSYSDNQGRRVIYKLPVKEQKEEIDNISKNFVVINSFYAEKQFERKDYLKTPDNFDFDYRKTLHWETDLKTDDKGIATIRFFTSDNRGVYKGYVDVYTDDGLFGVYEFSINVY